MIPRETMDQIHLPDPVKDEMQSMEEKIALLQKRIEELEQK